MSNDSYFIKVKHNDTEIDISGDKKFVEEVFDNIKYLLKREFISNNNVGKAENNESEKNSKFSENFERKKTYNKLKGKSLEELYQLKKPVDEYQKILLMAYYINKTLNKREFKAKDIDECYAELKMDSPKNLGYHLRRLMKSNLGLIIKGKKQGRFKISRKGIIFINNIQ